jgi:mannose-1-phosphate guanylyltransferase
VREEAIFAASVRSAATRTTAGRDGITLAGIEPDDVDPDLGYIVPGGMLDDGTRRVERFVEKPAPALARDLVARGAVWNSFIFWAHASTLLALIRRRLPEIVEDMANALARDGRRVGGPFALAELYDRLPVVDFSRDVVQAAESELRVSTVPACGWTDLGTPGRVGKTVQRLRANSAVRMRANAGTAPVSVDLAAKLARFPAVNSALFRQFTS